MRRARKTKANGGVEATLAAHKTSHGDFATCAAVSQGMLRVLRTGPRWKDLNDTQVEALQMIMHKCHRIVCGDPDEPDHFHDIAGYATLAEQEILSRVKGKK